MRFLTSRGDYRMGHVDSIDAHVICIPYADQRFVAMIILPDSRDGLSVTELKLMNSNRWNELVHSTFRNLPIQHVKLAVPKVDFRVALPMKAVMQSAGFESLFSARGNPLAGMAPRQDLCVSSYYQHTRVKFSSQGKLDHTGQTLSPTIKRSTAESNCCARSVPYDKKNKKKVVKFNVNHPFLFLICNIQDPYCTRVGFIGRVCKPVST